MIKPPFSVRTLFLGGIFLLSLCVPGLAKPTADALPSGLAWLTDGWRYHAGDNLAWANPGFDDADWDRQPPQKETESCAHGCWYRLTIQVPPHGETPLALLVLGQSGVFETYLDGERAGSADFKPWWLVREPLEFPLPLPAERSTVVLAIRVRPPRVAFDAIEAANFKVAIGGQQSIRDAAEAHHTQRVIRFLPSGAINLAIFLVGFGFLLVFALQQRQREYLWLAVYLMILGSGGGIYSASIYGIVPGESNEIYADPVIFLGVLAQTEFTFAFIGRKPNRLWRAYEVFLLCCPILSFLCSTGLIANSFYFTFESTALFPSALAIPILLFYLHRRGNREARWLILPSLAPAVGVTITNAPQLAGLRWNLDFFSHPILLWGSAPLFPTDIADAIFLLAIGAVMLARFTSLNREQARVSAELAAARDLQRQLVPATLPELAGCRLDAAYIPAAEVGGDFYQVQALSNGSSLLILGDVSGKGLKAAMTGALAIGSFRALAAEGLSPGALLARLNESLLSGSLDGFITCLCGQLSADGRLTLASAGHLPPYRNGEEVQLENGLPLGMISGLEYSETVIELTPGDRTVLVTDGVVEAQSPTGELFGFDRTREISVQPVAEMAAAAQAFGQSDDITVLSITITGEGECGYRPAETIVSAGLGLPLG